MSILDKGTLNPIKVDIFKGLHYSRTSDSYRRPRYLPTSLRVDDGFGSQSTNPAIGLRSADDWKLTFIVDGMD